MNHGLGLLILGCDVGVGPSQCLSVSDQTVNFDEMVQDSFKSEQRAQVAKWP